MFPNKQFGQVQDIATELFDKSGSGLLDWTQLTAIEVLAATDKGLSKATTAVAIWRKSQKFKTTTTFARFGELAMMKQELYLTI